MSVETISSLINLGAAGAVIIVVVIFLNFIGKSNIEQRAHDNQRDLEWRNFFTSLNSTNKDDVFKLAETMERMLMALDAHDAQAKLIRQTVEMIDVNTRPVRKPTV